MVEIVDRIAPIYRRTVDTGVSECLSGLPPTHSCGVRTFDQKWSGFLRRGFWSRELTISLSDQVPGVASFIAARRRAVAEGSEAKQHETCAHHDCDRGQPCRPINPRHADT